MFKTINEGKMPTRATKYSAAVDLYANEDVVIGAGETAIIGLGVCIDIQKFTSDITDAYKDEGLEVVLEKIENFKLSHYLELHPRSSLRAKGLISGVGIIDLDYKDEIKIIIHNPIIGAYLSPIKLNDGDFIGNEIILEGMSYEGNDKYTINNGDKIAQVLLKEHKGYLLNISSEDERTGGIGSTGEKEDDKV